jgi:hypothetical protein
MSDQHNATERFWRAYDGLPQDIQRRADKQFVLLKADPKHPSLQLKKLGEKHGADWWCVRVTQDYRALAIKRQSGFLWFWIGDHKTYDRLIG